ncbi:MAG: surfeit locus 1 family protein, partial [Nocardioidaceae bacterium]|nr:surfeit locus 1 family protein [Nocardioidaceae bacterium]
YALQWWVFGAFALFMWWRMCTETVAASRPKVA